jgi:excisionase family DNA binding protein
MEVVSVIEAARILGVQRDRVYKLIYDGKLPAYRKDGTMVLKVADLEKRKRWLAHRAQEEANRFATRTGQYPRSQRQDLRNAETRASGLVAKATDSGDAEPGPQDAEARAAASSG